jgi:uncharacterized C2H2 Zn-finger protein
MGCFKPYGLKPSLHCSFCGKLYRRSFDLIKHVHTKHNDSNKGETT